MILDFQLNTCCFAVYKPYKKLEIVMCMTLTLKQSQICSLNFNHYCLLWKYDNTNVGDDIKCKSIERFLCRYI